MNERLYNPAISDTNAAGTACDQGPQFICQCLKIGDLSLGFAQVVLSDFGYLATIGVSFVREAKQCANLVDRKSEVPCSAHKV
jgi:hypothetical protein